jgi:transcriptional regulator with XRE-family HTH domain
MNEPLGLRGPFVIRLRGRIPHPAGYPEMPRTLADHLKKARVDRGMPQRDATRAIGCGLLTFLHWEKGRVAPDVRFWHKILRFLGYDPRPEPKGFGGRIRAAREAEGLSERDLPSGLGSTPARWPPGSEAR